MKTPHLLLLLGTSGSFCMTFQLPLCSNCHLCFFVCVWLSRNHWSQKLLTTHWGHNSEKQLLAIKVSALKKAAIYCNNKICKKIKIEGIQPHRLSVLTEVVVRTPGKAPDFPISCGTPLGGDVEDCQGTWAVSWVCIQTMVLRRPWRGSKMMHLPTFTVNSEYPQS